MLQRLVALVGLACLPVVGVSGVAFGLPDRQEGFAADATLVAASPRRVIVRLTTGEQMTILLSDATQVCRRSCRDTWRALKVGDTVDVGFTGRLHGRFHAKWINANLVSDWAMIDAVNGQYLAVHSTRHPDLPAPYFFEIGADTIIEPTTADGVEVVGHYDGARVGDLIYYVGSTDVPGDWTIVHAWRVSPIVDGPRSSALVG